MPFVSSPQVLRGPAYVNLVYISCRNHTCISQFFKCPGFYCIPWRYVCSGDWQCPGGLDENNCNRSSCPGQFKCNNSVICLSMEDVCNGFSDCPDGEDEQLCFPIIPKCPHTCNCLAYSIHCSNLSSMLPLFSYPYAQVAISHSDLKDLPRILTQFNASQSLFIVENHAPNLCSLLASYTFKISIILLHISQNDIPKISKGCFTDMLFMKYLNISNNAIDSISRLTLSRPMLHLHFIDISYNPIKSLHRNMFKGITQIDFLYIKGNQIHEMSTNVFTGLIISTIITDDYKICCVKSGMTTSCLKTPVWPNSCDRLLSDATIQGSMWFVAVTGLLLNAASCLICKFDRLAISSSSAYRSMVLSLAIGDGLICASLFTIVLGDQIMGDHYLQYEWKWRKSPMCIISAALSIASNLISVFSIHLITVIRYYVIKYPLRAKSLDTCGIRKGIVLVNICLILTALGFVVCHHVMSQLGLMPNGLCLFLGGMDKSAIPITVTILTILSQSIPIILIPIFYMLLLTELARQQLKTKEMSFQHHEQDGTTHSAMIVALSNLVCWIPSSVLLTLTLSWEEYPLKMFLWTTSIVLPLNSLINPVIFVHYKVLKTLFCKRKN